MVLIELFVLGSIAVVTRSLKERETDRWSTVWGKIFIGGICIKKRQFVLSETISVMFLFKIFRGNRMRRDGNKMSVNTAKC